MKKAAVAVLLGLVAVAGCGPKPEEPVKQDKPAPKTAPADPSVGIRFSGESLDMDLPLKRDPGDINQTISSRQGGINYCYKRHIDQSGKARGRVVVSFVITQDGRVKDVAIVESDFEKEDFYDCLTESVMRWRFDKISSQGEEQNVRCPFEF